MNFKFNTVYLKQLLGNKVRKFIPCTFENLASCKCEILNSYGSKEKIKDLYVSMTTYEPRLDIFEYALLSVLNGSVLPEKILIYVPKGFRVLVENNPNSFLKSELDNRFIEMIEMEEDLGCHSKYYYSFLDFGGTKDIVTCDYDVI